MRIWLAALMLGQAAPTHHVVFVVDKVSQVGRTRVIGDNANAQVAEHHTGPMVMAEFAKKCPAVTFTQDQSVAEYVLQTQSGGSTLLDTKGTVLYVSPAKTLKNMVKDVCGYVGAH